MYQTKNMDWRVFLEQIAAMPARGDLKVWHSTVARRSAVSDRMVRALYERTCLDPRFSTGVRILEAAARTRSEANKLAAKIETAAGVLSGKADLSGTDEISQMVLRLLREADRLRGLDRA